MTAPIVSEWAKRAAAMTSSARVDWNTPQVIVDVVKRVGGGRIALDPCGNAGSIVVAEVEYRLDQRRNGLELTWAMAPDFGLVYVNPPYGREIGAWVSKCWTQSADGVDVIALVPARTDTNWFRLCWTTAQRVCFIHGRLSFLGAEHPAPFPSALVLWSQDKRTAARFELECSYLGHVVRP